MIFIHKHKDPENTSQPIGDNLVVVATPAVLLVTHLMWRVNGLRLSSWIPQARVTCPFRSYPGQLGEEFHAKPLGELITSDVW